MNMFKDDRWRTWEDTPEYGEILQKRARAQLTEMQSAIATSRQLETILTHGDSLLDVGCGVGHYYTSFKKRIPTSFTYTGADATPYYIELARETFADDRNTSFHQADIFALPFVDESFDVVNCSNVLLHLPQIEKPLTELCRVAKKHVLVRTLVGNRSFIVKEVKPIQDGHEAEFDADCEPVAYSYFNIYSRKYVETIFRRIPGIKSVSIREDWDFDQEQINADTSADAIDSECTRLRSGHAETRLLVIALGLHPNRPGGSQWLKPNAKCSLKRPLTIISIFSTTIK